MREIRPSGADTWMSCWGQPAYIETLNIVSTSTFYAEEGTVAHALGSDVLLGKIDAPNSRLGDIIATDSGDVEINLDMIDAVEAYVDEINKATKGNVLIVEEKIDCSEVLGQDRTGTGDAIIVHSRKPTLEIHDYKHGKGVEVFARMNKQMMIYGASFIKSNPHLGPFDRIKLTIHQPRIKEAPDVWTVSYDNLMRFAAHTLKMATKADNAIAGEGLFPGEKQCLWCDGKATCTELQNEIASVFDDLDPLFDTVTLPDDAEDLAERYERVPLVEMWCKAVRAAGFATLDRGGDLPGYKLVSGRRGKKTWVDRKQAVKALRSMRLRRDEIYDLVLKSPTKILKMLSEGRKLKLERSELFDQEPGQPTVAHDDDKRQEILRKPVFDDLTGD